MTLNDIHIIEHYRSEGATLREIGEQIGTSRETVRKYVAAGERGKRGRPRPDGIYPAIEQWLVKNRKTYKDLSRESGVGYQTVIRGLTGSNEMLKSTIDKLLEVLDMTYEQAFRIRKGI